MFVTGHLFQTVTNHVVPIEKEKDAMPDNFWDLEKAARIIKGLMEALDKKRLHGNNFFFDVDEVKREVEKGLGPGVGWVLETLVALRFMKREMSRGNDSKWNGVYIVSQKKLAAIRRMLIK